jgi:hypothetical protein
MAQNGSDSLAHGEDFAIVRAQEGRTTASKHLVLLSEGNRAFHPPQEGCTIAFLALDIDCLVAIHRIHDNREIQLLRVGSRKPGITVP